MKNKAVLYRIAVFLFTLVTIAATSYSVHAAETIPDLNKKGSILVSLKDKKNNKAVPGGCFTLYQVAIAKENNGDFLYQYVNGFENCGISLKNLNDSTLAKKLQKKVSKTAKGTSNMADKNGKLKYNNLSTGIYLIIQTEASDGYKKVSPFIVTVPLKMQGEWVYNVDASPKVDAVTTIQDDEYVHSKKPTTSNSSSSDSSSSSNASKETGNRLPKTGQLNWPIPVLCISGIVLFSLGWLLRKEETDS